MDAVVASVENIKNQVGLLSKFADEILTADSMQRAVEGLAKVMGVACNIQIQGCQLSFLITAGSLPDEKPEEEGEKVTPSGLVIPR